MEKISSKQNEKIVKAKKLLDKKGREQTNSFLIETEKVIKEALNCGLSPKCFYVLEEKSFDFVSKQDVPVYCLTPAVFKEISTLVTPDGIIAEFQKPNNKKEYVGGKFLILDNLQNPDNFGAIMRTAVASDFKQIYAINCVDRFNSKVIRASMGNQFRLNICDIEVDDIKKMFDGATIYTASMEGKNLFDINKFEKNVGIVIGNEGNGVSEQVRKLVDNTIAIPMENGIESLNAAVSAGIIMYYIYSKQ